MKISRSKLKQMIDEELEGLINEKGPQDAAEFSQRFPLKLSAVNPTDAETHVTSGAEEYDGDAKDDIISVNKSFEKEVGGLKPSQSSMNIGKALGMSLAMIMGKEGGGMPLGGSLGAFISEDDYIMDGHHRWIATAMVDPSKKVGGFQVGFPGAELIAILNAMTAGQFGITKGKAGSGGFDQFEEGPIRKQLLDYVKAGTPGEFGKGPDWVANAIEKFSGKSVEEGGVDATVEKFLANLQSLKPFKTPEGAPEREDMPVIDPDLSPGAYDTAIDSLETGKVDVNPPFHKTGGAELVKESTKFMTISKDKLTQIIKEELLNRKGNK